ncbi:MAG: XdhC family protein [Caulobacteraceae bacterium]|nr:XdhC family protein [Caulobacteraceae bacterium]
MGSAAQAQAFDWPFFGLKDDVRPVLLDAQRRGLVAVLATLYGVEGGAPRGVGAQMAFVEDMVAGYLSGGCIEADLALHARQVMDRRQPEWLIYGEGGPVDIRLPCGSGIHVLIEALAPDDEAVARLLRFDEQRRPAVWLSNGLVRACCTDAAEAPALFQPAASHAFSQLGTSGAVEKPFALFRAFAPRRRMIAIGGDPIALALVRLALDMGMEAILVRPNGPEACPIPGVRYFRTDIGSAIKACGADAWTAVALLGHDADLESAALTAVLPTSAAYIGVLGSRRRVPERNARLEAAGFARQDIERLHAPIGLPIGGKSPWEIAVSIIAEVVAMMDGAGQSDR